MVYILLTVSFMMVSIINDVFQFVLLASTIIIKKIKKFKSQFPPSRDLEIH